MGLIALGGKDRKKVVASNMIQYCKCQVAMAGSNCWLHGASWNTYFMVLLCLQYRHTKSLTHEPKGKPVVLAPYVDWMGTSPMTSTTQWTFQWLECCIWWIKWTVPSIGLGRSTLQLWPELSFIVRNMLPIELVLSKSSTFAHLTCPRDDGSLCVVTAKTWSRVS